MRPKTPTHVLSLQRSSSRRSEGNPELWKLTVGFVDVLLEPRYVEVEPIAGVRVLVERHLTELLASGATLVWRRGLLGRHLALALAHPRGGSSFSIRT